MILLFKKIDKPTVIFGREFSKIKLLLLQYIVAIIYYFIAISLLGFSSNLKFVGFIDLFAPFLVQIIGILSILTVFFLPMLVLMNPEITSMIPSLTYFLPFLALFFVMIFAIWYLIKKEKPTAYFAADFIIYTFGIFIITSLQGA